MIRRATLIAVLFALLVAACGDASGDEASTTAGPEPGSTTTAGPTSTIPAGPDEPVDPGTAAALPNGTPAVVTGFFVGEAGTTRLCSALAESYPPQCGGPSIDVARLDRADVVGVVTVGEPGLADVAWTNFPVTIAGAIDDGTLVAETVRQSVASADQGDVRVRLAVEPPQPRSGSPVGFAIDVTNLGAGAIDVRFSSGQDADVRIFDASGASVYTWSAAVSFIQMERTITLLPGVPYATVLTDRLALPAGEYTIEAAFVAADLSDIVVTASISIS